MKEMSSEQTFSRRSFLAAGAAAGGSLWWPRIHRATAATGEVELRAGQGRAPLVGGRYPETDVWCFNGVVPGPEIRVPQGSRLRVVVNNDLDQDTTVHWHGVRLPNDMDGVPHLTQKPIAPGERFVYDFEVPDAGTFWYHPHQRSFEQVGRGLSGTLIVEERDPIHVDRDVTWVLSDWQFLPNAQFSEDFGNLHDVSHAGRIGNTVTINGRVREAFHVRAGERIRLRLVNAANARVFGLEFREHRPQVVAIDGQPVTPHEPENGRVVLGPAMRVDLVLDFLERPGARLAVADTFYRGQEYRLLDLAYTDEEPLREQPLDTPVALPANPLPEPDLSSAERHDVVLGGGMMGGMTSATVGGRRVDMREMMRHGLAWAINGLAALEHVHEPMAVLARGRTYILDMHNDSAWWHPMHLHGHAFRVLSRNGTPTRHREWQDTVLMAPRERVEIAFVADNPGDWMFHCHVLEHQAGGMMGLVRVV
jgi:FtsP/CotA-like multicopper oxidase with cupredoxin domain